MKFSQILKNILYGTEAEEDKPRELCGGICLFY